MTQDDRTTPVTPGEIVFRLSNVLAYADWALCYTMIGVPAEDDPGPAAARSPIWKEAARSLVQRCLIERKDPDTAVAVTIEHLLDFHEDGAADEVSRTLYEAVLGTVTPLLDVMREGMEFLRVPDAESERKAMELLRAEAKGHG